MSEFGLARHERAFLGFLVGYGVSATLGTLGLAIWQSTLTPDSLHWFVTNGFPLMISVMIAIAALPAVIGALIGWFRPALTLPAKPE